ncbi:MAG: Tar ligand binding domain-containing protein [Lentisphaerae bacterium]|nr:Tar ligand binding domain-containing protein [Lentisphaerota bacterium]
MSLVEVMIAMGLFSIGMLGFFAMSGQLRNLREVSDNRTQATLLAESTIETMRARGVSTIASGTNLAGRYALSWTVVTNSGYASKHVQVVAAWQDRRSLAHQVQVNTVVAR